MKLESIMNMKRISIPLIIVLLISAGGIYAEDPLTLEEIEQEVKLTVSSSSGAPLLLEFSLIDPHGYVQRASIDFHRNGVIDYAVSLPLEPEDDGNDEDEDENDNGDAVVYRGIPFMVPGEEYSLEIQLETEQGVLTRPFTVSFSDFQWGRDNLRFANDNTFRGKVEPASDYLLSWAESRFGELSEQEAYLLVSLMYRMFRGNIGRCYGFSSAGMYYQEFPDVLSTDAKRAYDLNENDPEVQELIHTVQNDIMFHILITQDVPLDMEARTPQDLSRKIDVIKSYILEGKPVSVGYLSRGTHHSMVVYGFIYDEHRDRMKLTAANNWSREQKNNLSSEDVVLIPFYWDDGFLTFDWLRHTYQEKDRLFIVDPRREYHYERDTLEHILAKEHEKLIEDAKHRIIAEHVGWAYAEDDEESKRGYDGNRHYWGIPNILIRRFNDIHIMEVPADLEVSFYTGGKECEDSDECGILNLYIALYHEDEMMFYARRDVDWKEGYHEVYELDPDIPLEAKQKERE